MESKENKVKSVGFQLRNIVTDQFAVIQNSYESSNKEVALSINLKFGFNEESHLLGASVLVQFEQNKNPFLIIEVTNNFEIDKNSWKSFIKEDGKFVISKGFATHLIVLTVGTLRGVLHSKTENSEFNKFILPTVNVTDLVKGDVEIEIL